jgi:hypothetical protein
LAADPQEPGRAAGHPARGAGELVELAAHWAGADLGDLPAGTPPAPGSPALVESFVR